MKTGNVKSGVETVVFKDMNSTNVTAKFMKKHTSSIKTEAFGDKENVVERSAISLTEPSKPKLVENTSEMAKDKIKRSSTMENINEKKKSACESKNSITADDLTNTKDGPSENYWKLLAEQRKEALKETLQENEMLHNEVQSLHRQVEKLQDENSHLKQRLQEATEIIEVLNEIVAEETKEDESQDTEDEKVLPSARNSPEKVDSQQENTDDAFGYDSTLGYESDDSSQ